MGRAGLSTCVGAGGSLGILIIVVIIAWLVGVNPLELLSGGTAHSVSPGPSPQGQSSTVRGGASDEMRDFVATVLADTEDTWSKIFAASTARPTRSRR